MPSLVSMTERRWSTIGTIFRTISPRPFRRLRTTIPFTIADDIAGADSRVSETTLRIYLSNVVAGDRFNVALNGRSLAGETCRRVWKKGRDAYPHTNPRNHWLEFDLVDIVPRKGENVLEVSLESRPDGLTGNVTIAEVED